MNAKLKYGITCIVISISNLSIGNASKLEADSVTRHLPSKLTPPYFEFTQLGGDVDGRDDYPNDDNYAQYYGDRFGLSIAMNSDGSRVAVGAPGGGYCTGYDAYVDVLQLEFADDGNPQWVLLGNSIKSSIAGQQIYWGSSIGINGEGTRVVIGNAGDFYMFNPSMRVFDLDQTTDPPTWKLVGKRVPEEDDCYDYCDGGVSVAISQNGKHVAFEGNVYSLDEAIDTWVEVGTGLENCHVTGFSANGERVKCGVSIYELDDISDQWNQVGLSAIDGSGYSDLSNDGNSLAVIPTNSNTVQVYKLDEDFNWIKIGNDIVGINNWNPLRVSINADGNRVAIGMGNDPQYKVDVFDYNAKKNKWKRIGRSLEQENSDDGGYRVSMSTNGIRLVIGAPFNDDNGLDAGHFRAYEMQEYTTYQISSPYDMDGTGNSLCMQPQKMKSGKLVKAKPCKDNKKQQKWFHDAYNQIHLRAKPWLCVNWKGRAVVLEGCYSNSDSVGMIYDKDKKQIYVEKNKGIFYLGIDVTTKNIRLYLPQAANPTLSSWTMNPV